MGTKRGCCMRWQAMQRCRWRTSDGFRNWSVRNGSGWKTSTRSATTSWCTIVRGRSFERTALPLLPRYEASARRIRSGLGGADLPGVDLADAGSFRRRYADHSRVEGYYGPARGGAEVSRAV